MAKRVFLIVLDSFGIGAEPDAAQFGDAGANTLAAIAAHPNFKGDHLAELGLFNLDGVSCGTPAAQPIGSFARLREASAGKDTTIGHWEIAGLLSAEALPTFPDGFPQELLDAFTAKTGYKVLCNKPYSGTEVIRDYGEEHARTGALIVYTRSVPRRANCSPANTASAVSSRGRSWATAPPISSAPPAGMISAWCRRAIRCWTPCRRPAKRRSA